MAVSPISRTGVLAIAPFLGDRKLIEEISAAGGLAKWNAPPRVETMNPDNYQREMWRWFQAVAQGKESAPLLFAGYGRSDKLSAADSLLAAELSKCSVHSILVPLGILMGSARLYQSCQRQL